MKSQSALGVIAGIALLGLTTMLGCSDDPETSGSASTTSTSTSTSTSSSSSGGGGEGGGGGAGGGSASEYEQFCQADYERDKKCNGESDPSQVDECKKKEACDLAFFRDGALPGLHKCLVERPCGMGDDGCYAKAAEGLGETASTMAYGKGCTDKLTECTMAGTPFTDDYCYNYQLMKDGLLDESVACFMKPCDQINGCLDDVYSGVYAACGGPK